MPMSTLTEPAEPTELAEEASPSHVEHRHTIITVIEPRSGWQIVDWRELVEYRDLFWFLIWRNIKTRYAQSALGIGWAIIQPVFSMIVFTIVFGKLAKIDSEGTPYAIFSFTALYRGPIFPMP